MVGGTTSYLGDLGLHSGLAGLLLFYDPFHGLPKCLQVNDSTGILGLLNAHGFSFTTFQNPALPLGIYN